MPKLESANQTTMGQPWQTSADNRGSNENNRARWLDRGGFSHSLRPGKAANTAQSQAPSLMPGGVPVAIPDAPPATPVTPAGPAPAATGNAASEASP